MDARVRSFLIEAKRRTYAAKAAEDAPSRPGSHDLHWQQGDLLYIDTYLGGERFAGEEAVFVKGVPVWSMNYAGRVTGEGFSGDFLKAALLRVPEDKPYRGPDEYAEGAYRYDQTCEGDPDWFAGSETIRLDGRVVYECRFHGGLIR